MIGGADCRAKREPEKKLLINFMRAGFTRFCVKNGSLAGPDGFRNGETEKWLLV